MENVIEILKKWNPWEKEIDAGVQREDYIKKIRNRAKKYNIRITVNMCAKQDVENLEKFSKIGNREMMVARELTKQFETIYRGTLAGIKPRLTEKNLLGEFVVVIEARRRRNTEPSKTNV